MFSYPTQHSVLVLMQCRAVFNLLIWDVIQGLSADTEPNIQSCPCAHIQKETLGGGEAYLDHWPSCLDVPLKETQRVRKFTGREKKK